MSYAASPFGDHSEFQEEEVQESHYGSEHHEENHPQSIAESPKSNSILDHYSSTAQLDEPDETDASESTSFSAPSIPTMKVTSGGNAQERAAANVAAALARNVVPTFDEAKKSLDGLWLATTNPDPSTFSHSAYANDRFFGNYIVNVTDPEKVGEGLNSHVTYKCVSSLELSPGNVTQSAVTRRYSDFLWVHEQLFAVAQYHGFLVPPIPDKAVIGRFGEDFLEDRRRGLELFLRRVLAHPQLRHAEEVHIFLTGTDPVLSAARSRSKKSLLSQLTGGTATPNTATGTGGGVMGFFKEKAQDIAGVFNTPKTFDKTPDDAACEKSCEYAIGLENDLTILHEQFEMLMKREKNVARTYVELGLACSALGHAEGESGDKQLQQVFSLLANQSDQLAVLTAQKVELERQGVRDVVKDNIRLSTAVQQMMKVRAHVCTQFHQAQVVLEQRQNKQNVKDQAAQARLIAEAQQNLNTKQQELFEVTNRARVEFARFQKEKTRALKEAVKHYISVQLENARQVQNVWEACLPELNNI